MTIIIAQVKKNTKPLLACDFRMMNNTAIADTCDKSVFIGPFRIVCAGDAAMCQLATIRLRQAYEDLTENGGYYKGWAQDALCSAGEFREFAMFIASDTEAWSFLGGSLHPLDPGVHTLGSAGEFVSGYLAAFPAEDVDKDVIRQAVKVCAKRDVSISSKIKFL